MKNDTTLTESSDGDGRGTRPSRACNEVCVLKPRSPYTADEREQRNDLLV